MKKIKKLFCVLLSAIMLSTTLCFGSTAYAGEEPQQKSACFGTYPQSLVTDSVLLSQLNSQTLKWVGYNYYSGKNAYGSMVQGDFMKYADLQYNGAKYRAVLFEEYRADGSINQVTSYAQAQQFLNGYEVNHIYWFKFEPIKWYILDEGTGLMMSADLLDAQSFSNLIYQKSDAYYNNPECSVYANNYSASSVREWLNNDFYRTAFSEKEKSCILSARINNDAYAPDYAQYGSSPTEDKVFLLSCSDVVNASYGFSTERFDADSLRIADGSDYAKSQGLYVESVSGAQNHSYWSLRTAGSESNLSSRVSPIGVVSNGSYVYNSCYSGIRPAVCVNLRSCILGLYDAKQCTHRYSQPKVTKATCTSNGKKEYSCTDCTYKHIEPIKKLGHSYTSKLVKKPSCTAKEKRTYTCKRCSAKYSEAVNALGHKYKNKVVKPTYFAEGYTLHTCSQCKKSYKDKKKPKLRLKAPVLKKLTSKKKSLTVSWSKVKSVQGYEIQYSTDKKFKKNTKTVKVKKGSATSKTIAKLKKNKKYYVRIRAYKYQNKKYARSPWSKVKSMKVK